MRRAALFAEGEGEGEGERAGERGSAAVEFAMVLPAVAVLVGLVGVAAQCGVAAIRAQDAASAAARVAMTDSDVAARSAAAGIAGDDASVAISRAGGWIRVRVSEPAPWGLVVSASAAARAQD